MDPITLITAIVAAGGAAVAAGATVVYTIFTRRLWTETKRQAETATRQAETAERQAIIAQQMLEAAHRPWLSVELVADVGTGPGMVYFASVFRNHGNVPGTVTKTTTRAAWDRKPWDEGAPLAPTSNPSHICIFPVVTCRMRSVSSPLLRVPTVWPVVRSSGWQRQEEAHPAELGDLLRIEASRDDSSVEESAQGTNSTFNTRPTSPSRVHSHAG